MENVQKGLGKEQQVKQSKKLSTSAKGSNSGGKQKPVSAEAMPLQQNPVPKNSKIAKNDKQAEALCKGANESHDNAADSAGMTGKENIPKPSADTLKPLTKTQKKKIKRRLKLAEVKKGENEAYKICDDLPKTSKVAKQERKNTGAIQKTSKGNTAVEVIPKTAKENTAAMSKTSKENRAELPKTLKENTGAISKISKENTAAIPKTSEEDTQSMPKTSKGNTAAIQKTLKGSTEVIVTPKTSKENSAALPKTSKENTGAIPKISKENTAAIPKTSEENTGAIPKISKGNTGAIQKTLKGNTGGIATSKTSKENTTAKTSKENTTTITKASEENTGAIPKKPKGNTGAIQKTSKGNTAVEVIPKTPKENTTAIPKTSKGNTGAIQKTSKENTATQPKTSKGNAEAMPKISKANTENSKIKKPRQDHKKQEDEIPDKPCVSNNKSNKKNIKTSAASGQSNKSSKEEVLQNPAATNCNELSLESKDQHTKKQNKTNNSLKKTATENKYPAATQEPVATPDPERKYKGLLKPIVHEITDGDLLVWLRDVENVVTTSVGCSPKEELSFRVGQYGNMRTMSTNDPRIMESLKKFLKDKQVGYFTYTPKEKLRTFVVLRRPLFLKCNSSLVKQGLLDLKVPVVRVENLKLFLQPKLLSNYNYLVELKRGAVDLRQLFKLTTILQHEGWKWSKHQRIGVTQCRNCQRYGHVASNCHMPFRCVKCSHQHPAGRCERSVSQDGTDTVYCHNCMGTGHSANYRGCPAYRIHCSSRRRISTFSSVIRDAGVRNNVEVKL